MSRILRNGDGRNVPSRLFLVDFVLLAVIFWAAYHTYVSLGFGSVAPVHAWQETFWDARVQEMLKENCLGEAPTDPFPLPATPDAVQELVHLAAQVPQRQGQWERYEQCLEPRTYVVPEDLLHFRVNQDSAFEGNPEPGFATIRRSVDENVTTRRAIFILGHTDNTFTDQYNNELSYRRARTIAGVIEAHLRQRGLQAGRDYEIYPIGMGKTQLLAQGSLSTEAWQKACRRIELSFRNKGVGGHGIDSATRSTSR